METLFDWSGIPEPHHPFGCRENDGSVDWRKRCFHLAHAADALQLACTAAPPNPNWRGPPNQLQDAGDLVYYHLEHLRADYQREQETETESWLDGVSIPRDMEIERIKPALDRMLCGMRSDDRITPIVLALADVIQNAAAELGEDASQEANDLRAVCRRWNRNPE